MTDGLAWRLFVRERALLGTVADLDLGETADARLLPKLLGREQVCSGKAHETARFICNESGCIEDKPFQQYFTLSHIEVSPVPMNGRKRMERIRMAARGRFGAATLVPASFEEWLIECPRP